MFQEDAYPFFSLLSDFGGTIGMYLGLSILSIAEIFIMTKQIIKSSKAPKTREIKVKPMQTTGEEENESNVPEKSELQA